MAFEFGCSARFASSAQASAGAAGSLIIAFSLVAASASRRVQRFWNSRR